LKIKSIKLAILFLCFFSLRAFSKAKLSGFAKAYFQGLHKDFKKHDTQSPLLNIPLRLNFFWEMGKQWDLDFSWQLIPMVGNDKVGFLQLITTTNFKYRAIRIRPFIVKPDFSKKNSFLLFNNPDRLSIAYSTENLTFTVGRQIVTWGSGKFLSPTDVIVPFTLNAIDTEVRPGVDAVRLKYSWGDFELDTGYLFGNDFEHEKSAIFVRGIGHIEGKNFFLIYQRFKENNLFGFDFNTRIGKAKVSTEYAYIKGDKEGSIDYSRFNLSGLYAFSKDWSIFGGYHYNGIGTNDSEKYLPLRFNISFRDANLFLVGRNYFKLYANHKFSARTSIFFGGIYNFGDHSFLLDVRFTWKVVKNHFIDIRIIPGLGPSGSEFDRYFDVYYLAYRFYF